MNQPTREPSTRWTELKLRTLFEQSADVQIQMFRLGEGGSSSDLLMIYSEGLCDSSQIGKVILPELTHAYRQTGFGPLQKGHVFGSLPLIAFEGDACEQSIVDAVFQGDLLVVFVETGTVYKLAICKRPSRTPDESSVEISIKGPRDGFVEDVTINIALIRKRIRSNSLCCESVILGSRTRTRVGLLYIRDIISPGILNEVRSRLENIKVDGIYSIGQLEEALSDVKYSLFPLLHFTGRPDFVVASLLAGRFIIIVDGNPMVLIGPATFALTLKSPEDIHFGFQYVSFSRLLRIASFWVSIVLPGFWVSLTAFHQDQIPFQLMATISVARIGIPFSAQVEMFLLLVLLEIFREAGIRLPSSIGQTLTVIGGLIIGDAAIRAGLVSPSVVVVGAITAVMGATLINQSMSSAVGIMRFAIFLVSSILGMYGLILGLILLVFYMSRLKSFGIPYFAPLSPPAFRDMTDAYLRVPWNKLRNRPSVLHPTDPDHQGNGGP
ncbi:Spore germination protein XA [Paenibacillus solanacearum]|uniref:Spore germination protein XA n=1 Tax=Paenibacillus solanacearum TaxID=2048548 RepID=A0A916K798_9BACL|nr:spore germination protein [Paenibacillus solanacearum]CAG7650454.1 Spore germination protein XA [Paenibacillus solanacearum]